ncbi:MAG TPA: LUD domain-containing protein [Bacteroidota bacterium]|nr:LUD domain-containing protein [Bacteroidota bacterium]
MMTHDEMKTLHPRDVANKAPKENLAKSIAMALEIETDAVRLNTQTFNTNRYRAVAKLADYEELKTRARRIKEESIEQLPELIAMLTKSVEARGGHVYLAKTKEEAAAYILNVCTTHRAKLVVKAKSITSEEIGLNEVLEGGGIEVAETDLAEFILQISKEQPSHIVAPAIHRSRERITKLFKEHFTTAEPLATGEELTEFARLILRQKFLSADVGISGANLIAADRGTLLLVESEGNIRLTTQLPAVHCAIAGVEKIIRSKKDFGTFIELLGASGTGQPLTSYTNVLEPPIAVPILNLNGRSDTRREFHLVLVDNGRMTMRGDADLREALYCIRCSACMNVCANFQAVGGHAFGGECYTGGIGGAWTAGTSGSIENARFAELCTGCTRCVPNCPVRIDIPRLNAVLKSRLIELSGGPSLQKLFFGNFAAVGAAASVMPTIVNRLGTLSVAREIMERTIGFDKRRAMPEFAARTLVSQYKAYRSSAEGTTRASDIRGSTGVTRSEQSHLPAEAGRVVLFADVYTNYNNPDVGMATIRVFDRLGIQLTLSRVMAEGRDAQSQGLIAQAAKRARSTAAYLDGLISEGADIIVAEPSVLALFRHDYMSLIGNDERFERLKAHCFDPIEYLERAVASKTIDIVQAFHSDAGAKRRIFFHGHCQMKTIGAGQSAPAFFRAIGFDVTVSVVECCGMAGSFGYKKAYYDLSKNIGRDLAKQIRACDEAGAEADILASGTSCREQIGAEFKGRTVVSPIEYLFALMK